MPTPIDKQLYEQVKKYANTIYEKPSAYKSGFIVKKYKELGGKYEDDNKPKNLQRWFQEKWSNISQDKDYPLLRPTIRINNKTPLLPSEINISNLKKQIRLKQKIKGNSNLPPFIEK